MVSVSVRVPVVVRPAHAPDEELAAVRDFERNVCVHGVLAEELDREFLACLLIYAQTSATALRECADTYCETPFPVKHDDVCEYDTVNPIARHFEEFAG